MHLIKKARAAYQKYWFLLTQLVSRDFKTKYKRSVLGVLWSMLNPLLTMGVQYIVFSELFRWDIDNFAVYLLIGTVMFNFFTESTGQALVSITGSASLITKVYVPTYIFPVSKVLSSCINLGFSTLALYAILLIQGVPLNIYHLLMPFGYVCLIAFAIGIGLILASMMVYFRDTQFLYGIVTVLWMYLTPLFYVCFSKFCSFVYSNYSIIVCKKQSDKCFFAVLFIHAKKEAEYLSLLPSCYWLR